MIDKLVSMSFLKEFGDKCKRIFRPTKSPVNSGVPSYLFIKEDKIPAYRAYLLKINGVDTLNKSIDAVVYVNLEGQSIAVKAYSYGQTMIKGIIINYDSERKLQFVVKIKDDNYKDVVVDLMPLKETINNVGEIKYVYSNLYQLPEEYTLVGEFPEAVNPINEIIYSSNEDTSFTIVIADEKNNPIHLLVGPGESLFINKVYRSHEADKLTSEIPALIDGLVTGSGKYDPKTNYLLIQDAIVKLGENKEQVILDKNTNQWTSVVKVNKYGVVVGIGDKEDLTIPLATDKKVGGILLGAKKSDSILPVELDSDGRAYIEAPKTEVDLHRFMMMPYPEKQDWIVEYIGVTNKDYVNGYFYQSYSKVVKQELNLIEGKNYILLDNFGLDFYNNKTWDDGTKINADISSSFYIETDIVAHNFKLIDSKNKKTKVLSAAGLADFGIKYTGKDEPEVPSRSSLNITLTAYYWKQKNVLPTRLEWILI